MKTEFVMWFHRVILRHEQHASEILSPYFSDYAVYCSCTRFWGRGLKS